jgi:hypothetical protein
LFDNTCAALTNSISNGSITVSKYILGDVSNDGKIMSVDALMALQAVSGRIVLTAKQKCAADVNKDGIVSVTDALKILQFASNRIKHF